MTYLANNTIFEDWAQEECVTINNYHKHLWTILEFWATASHRHLIAMIQDLVIKLLRANQDQEKNNTI
jgi:hypothetical protein